MMKWRKLGLIFKPNHRFDWMQTHATAPIALHLDGDLYRVYFSTRDKLNRSHVGYFDFNIKQPDGIINIADKYVLAPGELGCFDDHGVYAGCTVKHEGKIYLYYLGWNPGAYSTLFYTSIGIATSDDMGRTFKKLYSAPIIQRSEHDPWCVLLPYVLKENNKWRMWYGSGIKWERRDQEYYSYYDIKYAESLDGINWKRDGFVCIGLKNGETNVAHPNVIVENGKYKMWYSYNEGRGYRIGYAESFDGVSWIRMDNAVGISPSDKGWDSETISHPHVIIHDGKKYMLYNGNGFGRDGVGLAVEI